MMHVCKCTMRAVGKSANNPRDDSQFLLITHIRMDYNA